VDVLCSSCKKEIDEGVNFCPYCGHRLNLTGAVLTSTQKIRIYLASFFLSPFGLIWFFKYFRDDELENRRVAHTSLIITLVPLTLILVIGGKYINSLSSIIEMYETNLDVYSELGL
jgi:hypothetical protein